MEWCQIFSLAALAICIVALTFHMIKIVSAGIPRDFSRPAGNPKSAMPYAFIGAMSPKKKESALLYLPTYIAGILYHMGTFAALTLYPFILFQYSFEGYFSVLIAGSIAFTGACGFGILIKRIIKSNLRALSNPDDYFSNFIVSVFHWITATVLFAESAMSLYFLIATMLFLYIPLGKLKHMVYFFAARYHLGFFYGRRGVWPPK
jgi:hypothetical protein